jgi:hypothetical protein
MTVEEYCENLSKDHQPEIATAEKGIKLGIK